MEAQRFGRAHWQEAIAANQMASWSGNWTLDTISNLLFAIDAELDFTFPLLLKKSKSNEFHDLNWPVVPPAKETSKTVDTTGGTVILLRQHS